MLNEDLLNSMQLRLQEIQRTLDMFPTKVKQDYTKHGWFERRKNTRNGNLLFEVIPNFSYWKKFGQNTLDKVTYIGKNEYMDKLTGYVLGWDKTHRCDRCGKKLNYTGSRNIRLAWACAQWKRFKEIGLCPDCDLELEKEKKPDGIYTKRYPSKWVFSRQTQPQDIYRQKYIWL